MGLGWVGEGRDFLEGMTGSASGRTRHGNHASRSLMAQDHHRNSTGSRRNTCMPRRRPL